MKSLFRIVAVIIISSLSATKAISQVSLTATGGTASASYTSLNAAFAAINAGTHQGAIDIRITGNITEPAPPTPLLANNRGTANYASVVIAPAVGTYVISAASPSPSTTSRGIIECYGVQHLTIDGDPFFTGSNHLIFQLNTTPYNYVSAIRLGSDSNAITRGCAYDTIRNCDFIGGRNGASPDSSNNTYGIVCSGNNASSITLYPAYGCFNNAFINNSFVKFKYATYFTGPYSVPGSNTAIFKNNRFGSAVFGTSNSNGIYLYHWQSNTDSSTIDGNDFTGSDSLKAASNAIFVSQGNYSPTVPALRISNNNIHDIVNGNSEFSAIRLAPYDGSLRPAFNLDIYDNRMEHCTTGGNSCQMLYIANNGASGSMQIYDNTCNDITTTADLSPFSFTALSGVSFHHNTLSNLKSSGSVKALEFQSGSRSSIHDNVINGLVSTGAGKAVYGIVRPDGEVYNNFIGGLSALQNSTDPTLATPIGISVSTYARIYHNTIALNTANQSGSLANTYSHAIYVLSTRSRIQDNIIVNTQNSSNAYGLYTTLSTGNFALDTLDYNSYYEPYGSIGYLGGPQGTLSAWQAATFSEAHAVSGYVPFVSAIDLHIDTNRAGALALYQAGLSIPGITTDIDGQLRHSPPCIGADEFVAVNVVADSVWPGDADADHLVSNADLLPIGLAYDSIGPARSVVSIFWQAQGAADWVQILSGYVPGVNYKHADCNGDGIVNANDTLAIVSNFALTHSKTTGSAPWRSNLPGLKAVLSADSLYAGDTLTVTFVLGDSIIPASNIYGLAFTYNFDPLVVDSAYTTTSIGNSWLGTTDKISIAKTLHGAGQIKAAVTRIDHISRSGNGPIGIARFKITTDNISGKDLQYYANVGFISDVSAIDQDGNSMQLNEGVDTSQVGYTPTGIRDMVTERIAVHPNPAHDRIDISADHAITDISIITVAGQHVYHQAGGASQAIDVSALQSGLYFVHITTTKSSGIAKLSVVR